jgi:hypothetical protein
MKNIEKYKLPQFSFSNECQTVFVARGVDYPHTCDSAVASFCLFMSEWPIRRTCSSSSSLPRCSLSPPFSLFLPSLSPSLIACLPGGGGGKGFVCLWLCYGLCPTLSACVPVTNVAAIEIVVSRQLKDGAFTI